MAEFSAVEYWIENYAIKGGKEKNPAPNAMWMKRPRGQIAKCASAQALRIAFPEIASAPTAEEMEGKSFAVDSRQSPAIDVHDEADESLIVEAEIHAKNGVGAYTTFWKTLDKASRAKLITFREHMATLAKQADADAVVMQ